MMIPVKSILLVEDNPNDAELTTTALEDANLANTIEWVKDGVEALDYLYHRGAFENRIGNNPVLIMLDLKLPRVDGKEVLRQVKGDPALRKIPVVILTSSREEKDLVESYDLGVNAYVVKPVEFGRFVAAVRELGTFWALVNEVPPGTGA